MATATFIFLFSNDESMYVARIFSLDTCGITFSFLCLEEAHAELLQLKFILEDIHES
jgi:hypothetical protein